MLRLGGAPGRFEMQVSFKVQRKLADFIIVVGGQMHLYSYKLLEDSSV